MSTAGLINRYVWFVTTIYNRGPITLEEIQHRFESHFGRGEELSERQFHRYTDAVEELFDIEIKYSRSQRGYVVADREGIDNIRYAQVADSDLFGKWNVAREPGTQKPNSA